MDSITHIAVIDTVHRVIADSVTLEALKISQEFYSSAFSNFTIVVSVLALFLIAFTVIAVAVNFKSAKGTKRKLEEVEKELKNFKEQYENKIKGLMNLIEDSKQRQRDENKKLPLKLDAELQQAIDTTFSNEQKKQDFINDYIREIKIFREDDPDTLAILGKFQKEKRTTEFIKYLEGFFEALSYWNKEKLNSWTLLSKKQKETEFLECMKQIDDGKLGEFQRKCARFQSIIPKKVFFLDPQNFINSK